MSREYFTCNLYWLIENRILNDRYRAVSLDYKYIEDLLSLYKKSKNKSVFKTDRDIDKFIDWIIDYRKLTAKYAKFVESHGIDLTSRHTAELDKNIIDSIVGKDATVISPSASTMNKPNYQIVQNSHTYMIIDGLLIKPSDKGITTIITQNPYYISPRINYLKMREEGYNIGIGVYGYDDDLDREEKLDSLKKMRQELGYGRLYTEEEGDNYFSLFKAVSVPKSKRLQRLMDRRSQR